MIHCDYTEDVKFHAQFTAQFVQRKWKVRLLSPTLNLNFESEITQLIGFQLCSNSDSPLPQIFIKKRKGAGGLQFCTFRILESNGINQFIALNCSVIIFSYSCAVPLLPIQTVDWAVAPISNSGVEIYRTEYTDISAKQGSREQDLLCLHFYVGSTVVLLIVAMEICQSTLQSINCAPIFIILDCAHSLYNTIYRCGLHRVQFLFSNFGAGIVSFNYALIVRNYAVFNFVLPFLAI